MMLTDDQKGFFDAFGFLALPGLLTRDEAATMERESEEIMAEARGGSAFDGRKWQPVQPFFERRPFLRSLIGDDRIHGIAEGLLGPDYFLIGTEGNLHVGDTPWHGGGGSSHILPHVKIAFYLEPLTADSGALRLIPGSHRGDFAERLAPISHRIDDDDVQVFGVSQPEVPAFVVETEPGDVLVFTEDTYHGAWGGRPGRHQHAMSFQQVPRTDEQWALVQSSYDTMNFGYHPTRTNVESPDPRVRKLVAPLLERGYDVLDV